ncbi:MAG: GPGG-motif small membrane protein [Actinomycetia bacterium]|nr:GPGG-motif small membrane protein [Actinomycetes bacterium]
MNSTILMILAVILAVVGVVQLIQGQIIFGIVLLIAAALVGPGVCGIAGAAVLIFGLVALARADVDGTFNEPIFQVAGFDHTQLLAFVEIVLGGLLLAAAGTSSLSGMRVLGSATVIAAFVALIEPNVLGGNLEIEGGYATLILVLGAATLIAAAVLPTIERQTSRVSTHHEADRSNSAV